MAVNNIEMFAGNTKRIIVLVKDDAGENVDISDALACTFKAVEAPMGRAKYNSVVKITKVLDDSNGGVNINPTDSIITITLEPSDTAALKGQYFFELKLTEANGDVSTIVNGLLTVKESIS